MLWGFAVGRLPVATSLLYLVPPVAVLVAYLWLGEIPLLSELLGGVVGVVTVSVGDRLRARLPRHERDARSDHSEIAALSTAAVEAIATAEGGLPAESPPADRSSSEGAAGRNHGCAPDAPSVNRVPR